MRGHHGVSKAIPRQNGRVVDYSLSLYPVGTKIDSSLFSPLVAGKSLLPAAALPAVPSCSVVATVDTDQTRFTSPFVRTCLFCASSSCSRGFVFFPSFLVLANSEQAQAHV